MKKHRSRDAPNGKRKRLLVTEVRTPAVGPEHIHVQRRARASRTNVHEPVVVTRNQLVPLEPIDLEKHGEQVRSRRSNVLNI